MKVSLGQYNKENGAMEKYYHELHSGWWADRQAWSSSYFAP